MLDSLYLLEVDQIVRLQNCIGCYGFFEFISEFFSPTALLFYFVPLLAGFDTEFFGRMMITAALTEYINVMLKWVISANRPYWWLPDTKAYAKGHKPIIRQFRLTCESTSGFPSGHLMIFSALGYLLCAYLIRNKQKFFNNLKGGYIKWISYIILGLLITVLTISRMYFGCHFGHQCVAGAIFGIIIAYILERNESRKCTTEMPQLKGLLFAGGLTTSVFAFYWLKKYIGSDPAWAIRMAFKRCENPAFVKYDTTAMFGLSRDMGILFAIGLASPIKQWLTHKLDTTKSVPVTITLMVFQRVFYSLIPTGKGYLLFYFLVFCLYLAFTFLYLAGVPKFCSRKQPQDSTFGADAVASLIPESEKGSGESAS